MTNDAVDVKLSVSQVFSMALQFLLKPREINPKSSRDAIDSKQVTSDPISVEWTVGSFALFRPRCNFRRLRVHSVVWVGKSEV